MKTRDITTVNIISYEFDGDNNILLIYEEDAVLYGVTLKECQLGALASMFATTASNILGERQAMVEDV